ncbi:bifunctional hydroxymethylpyrimidine kinase/phosphomethylpyrimidine kinase [Curvibacter sp. RS43]|uniref:bifunctional hydroxymethylpyrimidine kinase/phosphomethylpyrimidine kinase n=1 Tax=Curvibacter microcysteis TaxID=3026419 RepID=UPI00235EBBCA|nr:bifunctional hydroxymethylpyrimidine kinase/phosphomethylpyrimidine kinase [Curvibacter sp. RS43]MDD0809413.1 bifunctional hydroxymethylpyrimidine kinase/phosphomethylpyrimidine kinase [Curvibacter sp. RS43]
MTDSAASSSSSAVSPATRYLRVLSIAGSDSGGGAGIQADLKTMLALGCHGMTAITALTAQNTLGVRAVHPVPVAHLIEEMDAVAQDIGVDAVKTGMLPSAEAVLAVAQALDRYQWSHLVLDPVMVSTSGHRLMNDSTATVLVRELFPRASLITPNLDEAEALLGHRICDASALEPAAHELLALGARAVLLKGGHLPGEEVVDLLLARDGTQLRLSSPRIASRNTHGTGCTLSAAVACGLAGGLPLAQAVSEARAFIVQAIRSGAGVQVGQGHGPLNHGLRLLPSA